jgi:hypothetical protein
LKTQFSYGRKVANKEEKAPAKKAPAKVATEGTEADEGEGASKDPKESTRGKKRSSEEAEIEAEESPSQRPCRGNRN